jgi:glycine cleavage system transcriptional repressor
MPDREQLILTATGPDQVGLVEKISEFLARRSCNIEDSKMAVFCGEFAIILLITGSSVDLSSVASGSQDLERETGLIVRTKIPAVKKASESLLPYKLTASCMDHPGIVHRISGLLRSLGVNIQSMETRTYSAPVSGTPLFRFEAELSVPARTNIGELRELLNDVQREENIDIELRGVANS